MEPTQEFVNYEDAANSILSRPPVNASTVTQPGQDTSVAVEDQPEPAGEAQELEQTAETQTDETAEEENLLPSEQESDYATSVYERYAKRLGMNLQDLDANPRLRAFVKSKIDTDVYVQQQRSELERLQQQMETYSTEAEPEAVPTPQAAPASLDEARNQYMSNLNQFANTHIDPWFAEQFAKDYYKAWGIDKPSKEDMGRAMPIAQSYYKFMLAGMNTAAPKLLGNWIEQNYPGFAEAWERSTYQRAYEAVQDAGEAFAQLPKYGTQEFQEMMYKVAEIEPDFENMIFRDQNGNRLDTYQTAMRQYRLAAQISLGSRPAAPAPKVAQQLVERGKVQQQLADQKRAVGKVTGAGQSQGAFARRQQGAGSGLGLVEAYAANHPEYGSKT